MANSSDTNHSKVGDSFGVEIDGFVPFASGQLVPLAALRLGWDLEDRGFVIQPVKGQLLVRDPTGKAKLTPEDRAAITKWKAHLMVLAEPLP